MNEMNLILQLMGVQLGLCAVSEPVSLSVKAVPWQALPVTPAAWPLVTPAAGTGMAVSWANPIPRIVQQEDPAQCQSFADPSVPSSAAVDLHGFGFH